MNTGSFKKGITQGTIVLAMFFVFFFLTGACCSFAADNGLPDGYEADEDLNRDLSLNKYGVPVHQFKNVFESETVTVPDIDVMLEDSYDEPYPVDEAVPFRIYNCTTQETEQTVYTADGKLTGLRLRRGHAYLITSADEHYIISHYQDAGTPMNRIYVWALKAGDQNVTSDGAYDYKTGYTGDNEANYLRKLGEIDLHHSADGFYDPLKYTMQMPVTYNGEPVSGVRFVFTSDETDPVTAVSQDGTVHADLIEDVDYTVHVQDDTYDIGTFTLAVKDKSEHKITDDNTGTAGYEGRYCYDHTCCQGCGEFRLISKADKAESQKGSVSSLRKSTSKDGKGKSLAAVCGMDFKNLLLLVRSLEVQLPDELKGLDCQITELTLVNPHRWEICRITDTPLRVSLHLNKENVVQKLYRLQDGELTEMLFTQPSADTIEYSADAMPAGAAVIVYSDKSYAPEESDAKPVKPAKPAKTSLRKLTGGRKKLTAVWKKQTRGTSGYQIQYSTSKKFSNRTKTITVKGSSKTKYTIKKLKSKKRYYVRIRTYKTSGRKKLYSGWSSAKSVRVR